MTGKSMRIVLVVFALLVAGIGAWVLMYPSSNDPKNIRYVLWKAGLCSIKLDAATAAMVGDRNRDKLVVGKSREQLRHKFGPLLSPAATSPYLRGCYQNSGWKDREVLFIGESSWMVVFDGDSASNLVLIKGC